MLQTFRSDIPEGCLDKLRVVFACGSGKFLVSAMVKVSEQDALYFIDPNGDLEGMAMVLVDVEQSVIECLHLFDGGLDITVLHAGHTTSSGFVALTSEETERTELCIFTRYTILCDDKSVQVTSTSPPQTASWGGADITDCEDFEVFTSGCHVICLHGIDGSTCATNMTTWSPLAHENLPWRVRGWLICGVHQMGDYLLIVRMRDIENSTLRSIVLGLYHIPTACTVAEVDAPNEASRNDEALQMHRHGNGSFVVYCDESGLLCVTRAFQHSACNCNSSRYACARQWFEAK